MIKKVYPILVLLLGFLLFPSQLLASKLEAPNLVEVKVDGKFTDQKNLKLSQAQVLEVSGNAQKGSQVFLYFSTDDEPLLAKVTVDKNGYWFYTLNQALAVGNHTIKGETHSGKQISANKELLKFEVMGTGLLKTVEYRVIFYSILILLILIGIVLFLKWKKIFPFRPKQLI